MDLPHYKKLDKLNRLIIFTRYPELGKNKTRLIPALEDAMLLNKARANATNIHRRLAEHTLAQCRQWCTQQSLEIISETTDEIIDKTRDKNTNEITVCFTGGNPQLMAAWLGTDLDYQPQGAGDLGQRIILALQHLQKLDIAKQNNFVIIGTDCPDLNSSLLDRAFQGLESKDLVLGQAKDGGYYLIGFKQIIPQLFQDISWGTEKVFMETVTIATKLDLRINYLPVLRDIDRPEDLDYLSTLAGFENI